LTSYLSLYVLTIQPNTRENALKARASPLAFVYSAHLSSNVHSSKLVYIGELSLTRLETRRCL